MAETIFSKIIKGEIPSTFLHEDDLCIAINDINPLAPVHILIIPKKPIPMLAAATDEDQAMLGHLLLVARDLAKAKGISDHFRLLINNGEAAGQTVFHLHVHLLGNDTFTEGGMGRGL